jgi:hypothetical protein
MKKADEYDFSKGKRGAVLPQKGKTRITIYVDTEVLDAFRKSAESEGRGYQTAMNEALRAVAIKEALPIEERVRSVLREELAKQVRPLSKTQPMA